MNHTDASVMERECPPGQLIRMVAGQLTAHGFDARSHEPDDDVLTIAGLPGLRCSLKLEEDGQIECEYLPRPGWETDPARVAGLVVSRLASDSARRHDIAERPAVRGFPLRTFIGTELKAAGLDVGLEVYSDLANFKVIADLVVTNPDHPERGKVRICDDSGVIMECGSWEDGTSTAGIEVIAELVADDVRRTVAKFNAAISLPPAEEQE